MFFVPCSISRQWNPLVLVPKKSITLQSRQQSSTGVAPVLGGCGASVIASSDGQTPPMMAPMPSAGHADVGAEEVPSKVTVLPMVSHVPSAADGGIDGATNCASGTDRGQRGAAGHDPIDAGGGGGGHDRSVTAGRNHSGA